MVQTTSLRQATARGGGRSRAADRSREILDAAARVFRRLGLAHAGMRDIAAELGMAVGNLYYYFRDKEELLAFVQQEALAALIGLAARVHRLPLGAADRLHLLIAGHVVRLNEGTPGALAHLEVEALGERFRPAVQARRDAYERAFRREIAAGSRAGVFRACDPKVAARVILGAANWTVKWFRPDGGKSALAIGCEAAELLVRGLLAPGVAFAAPPAERVAERLAAVERGDGDGETGDERRGETRDERRGETGDERGGEPGGEPATEPGGEP